MSRRVDGFTWVDDLDEQLATKLNITGGTITGDLIITGDLTVNSVDFGAFYTTFNSLVNQSVAILSSPTFAGLTISTATPYAPLYANSSGRITSTSALTNGQLLIGSTGAAPVVTTLTAGNNMTITNAPGSITVAMVATPSFSGVTIIGATGLASFSSAGVLQDTSITNTNGCSLSFTGSTLNASMSQNLTTSGSPTFAGFTVSALTGGLVSASTGGVLQNTSLVGNFGMSLSFAGSTLTIATPQDLRATASPTHVGLTLSGLASALASYSSAGVLQTTTFASSNGISASFASGVLSLTASQNLTTGGSPTFAGFTVSALTGGLISASTSGVLQNTSLVGILVCPFPLPAQR